MSDAPSPRMPRRRRSPLLTYARGLAAPLLLWLLFVGVLVETLRTRLSGDEPYDSAALSEWIEESRVFRENLPGLVRDYLHSSTPAEVQENAEKVRQQLAALGDVTKIYQGQLPLFPAIYRLEIEFAPPQPRALAWDSKLPRHAGQVHRLAVPLYHDDAQQAVLNIDYLLHAFNKRQRDEQAANVRLRWMTLLAVAGTVLAIIWIYLVQRRERRRAEQRRQAQGQIDQAERRALEERLRREEAERQRQETERKLLEQRLATQAAERQALELKSQLYASIGIMAGSYAHNIKNLLVRPNDLLRRCLEADRLADDQTHMLQEVRETLGTVTERLQQILRTVRRDPTRSEQTRLDLDAVAQDIVRTWAELARDKWKLDLRADLCAGPLPVEGDVSYLQQAVENLLFNGRDATFEMRNHLRNEARQADAVEPQERRSAIIAAAGWRGAVQLRTRRDGEWAVLEVIDNGIGMDADLRRRCTETHFTTKRQNAIYEGHSTGMGLGLSFVAAIVEHHRGRLEIESTPLHGACFRLRLPLANGSSKR